MKDIKKEDVFSRLKKRDPLSNKGNYGTLLSVCGSETYRGAALLSSLGALRSGVGILRLASVESVAGAVAASLPEVTFDIQKTGENGEICGFDIKKTLEKYPRINACLVGCGLGTSPEIKNTVDDIIRNAGCPMVLDADALNCIADHVQVLLHAKKGVVITPHVGEFARLCKIPAEQIKLDPEKYALDFSKSYGVTVALKDHFTVIASPTGECYGSRFGNAGLARGGSGDILAGMTASFLSQGMTCSDAAVCACALHGMAADRCAARLSQQGMLPHDIVNDLCQIFLENGR